MMEGNDFEGFPGLDEYNLKYECQKYDERKKRYANKVRPS